MATLRLKCSTCGTCLAVDDVHLGRTGRCKTCGAKLPTKQLDTRPDPAATHPSQPTAPARPSAPQSDAKATEVTQPTTPPSGGEPLPSEVTVAQTEPRKPEDLKTAEDAVPAEWNAGDVILDTYEVKQVHTGGGMGLVYRVHHRNWNMDLAVKSPRANYFQTDEQKENFVRECETWVNLGLHPNIVSCYYVRTLGGIPRVFAEYVEGGSLNDWIESKRLYAGGPKEALKRILDIVIQFAWGLHYAHEHEDEQGKKQHLVHQDVKPANVMMAPDGTAKVTDFGLAKARATGEVAESGPQRSTLVSSGGMTPAYCSPEQANREPLSRKTDIWSWGLSLLEMFTGEVTWASGVAAAEALDGYLEMGAENEAIPKMPPDAADLLRQCFRRNPDERPKDMAEVAGRLKSIYQQVTGQSYAREEPKAAELLADGLNNRAVSMLDLGRREKAERLLEEALRHNPRHPEATYNQGLLLWRSERLDDMSLVTRLREIQKDDPQDWRAQYLEGLTHVERLDAEAAVEVLERSLKMSGSSDVGPWLERARSLLSHAARCVRTFEGHTALVESVCLSADGRWALSGSWDGTLRLWEVGTGRCVRAFEGPTEWETPWVMSVCLSADGRWALSGRNDKTLRLWDVATGQCVRIFEGHAKEVMSVCLSADGRWALSGGYDKTLRLWEVAKGRCVRTFEGHPGWVMSVCLSADGRWALSGSLDKTLRLWDVATGRCVRTFAGHTDLVRSVCLSADGRWALSGSVDKTLRFWDVATGRCVRTFEGHAKEVRSVCLSADGRWALSGSNDKTLRLWDLTMLVRSVWPEQAPAAVCRVRGSEEVARTQARFEALLGEARRSMEQGAYGQALGLVREARSIPGRKVSSGAMDLWHQAGLRSMRKAFSGGWCVRTFEGHTEWVMSVCLSADGRWAMSGSNDKTLRLWDAATGRCVLTFEGHTDLVRSVCLSADGRWAMSGSNDKTLRLWEVATGQCVRTFKGHTDLVRSVCLSADGRWALSGSFDKTLRLWDVATGRCVRTFEGHTERVMSVCLSADGRWALSGGNDKTLRLWDVATGRCVRTFEGHTGELVGVCLSADGRWALSSGEDPLEPKTLRLWDVATGRCMRVFEGHTDSVESVCLSADGRWALSGSRDKTLRLWDVPTGRCVRTFEGHSEAVKSVCLSADGRWLLSGGGSETPCLWELDWDFEPHDMVDWDEGARPYLEIFLTLLCAYGPDGVSRVGKPVLDDEDLQSLLKDLQYRGYGWLRPEGVRKKIEEMTANWQGPPLLPWESPDSAHRPEEVHIGRPGAKESVQPIPEGVQVRTTPREGTEPADSTMAAQLPGRNDPCPCGSGKKYKVCCGKPSVKPLSAQEAKPSPQVVGQTRIDGKEPGGRRICSCGTANPPANTFCVACGNRLPEAAFAHVPTVKGQ